MPPKAIMFLTRSSLRVDLVHESRGPYGRLFEFQAPDLGEGSLTIQEDDSQIVLDTIDIEPQGTGLGTQIIDLLREYADLSGKIFKVPGVMNLDFFSRFSWLEWTEPIDGQALWSAEYTPGADGEGFEPSIEL